MVHFGQWELPDGGGQNILLVGFPPEASMGKPWNISAGRIEDLKMSGTVMVDELYKAKLGVTHLGQNVEIRSRRARVVGFTRGIRTFTTAPAVFTSFKNAQEYTGLHEDQVVYILVQAAPGVDVQTLKQTLVMRLQGVDVYTTAEWSHIQRTYWMIETGAGITVLLSAILGVLVGGVVVTQTIYAATVDHIREYATLKAMGAGNGYIYRVIVEQAAMSACIGYVLGMAISLVTAAMSQNSTTAIIIPWPLIVGIFGLTLLMCIGASMVSITKVIRLDPAMVFRN
jgi:putative ABC transport system permease protein